MRVSLLSACAVITVIIAYFVYLLSYEHCGLAFVSQQLRWINKETPGMVMI